VTERAVSFALRLSEDVTALHISSARDNKSFSDKWRVHVQEPAERAGYSVPKLEVIYSPYRRLYTPLIDAIERMKRRYPDRLVAVVIPELVKPRWWQYFLHNHAATALKALILLKCKGVVVISIPWYLNPE